ncbi:hypothetical protein EDD94_7935 [Streptomyces sp. PanSC9]|nr:hypothetical protein EDD94_7935 [Streptomyces sp. PanSC9]
MGGHCPGALHGEGLQASGDVLEGLVQGVVAAVELVRRLGQSGSTADAGEVGAVSLVVAVDLAQRRNPIPRLTRARGIRRSVVRSGPQETADADTRTGGDDRGQPRPPGPPRLQGRHGSRRPDEEGSGATPAGAGTTRQSVGKNSYAGSYPRRSGDNDGVFVLPWLDDELPPRLRGRSVTSRFRELARRLRQKAVRTQLLQHRTITAGCEVGPPIPTASTVYSELPPQARGRQRRGVVGDAVARATPADAGTTCCAPRRAALTSYPLGREDDTSRSPLVFTSIELPAGAGTM